MCQRLQYGQWRPQEPGTLKKIVSHRPILNTERARLRYENILLTIFVHIFPLHRSIWGCVPAKASWGSCFLGRYRSQEASSSTELKIPIWPFDPCILEFTFGIFLKTASVFLGKPCSRRGSSVTELWNSTQGPMMRHICPFRAIRPFCTFLRLSKTH